MAKASPSRASLPDPAVALRVRRILVPVDFSEAGEPALRYAQAFARLSGASVRLVHVMEDRYVATGPFGESLIYSPVDRVGMRESVSRKIGALQVDVFRDTPSDYEIRDGVTHDEIVRAAQTWKADLIIMATHGYTGLQHVLLGSTTERVVRHASCPVLVVRSALARSPRKVVRRRAASVSRR